MKKLIIFACSSTLYGILLLILFNLGVFSFGKTITFDFPIFEVGLNLFTYFLFDVLFILGAYFTYKQYMIHPLNTLNKLYRELKMAYILMLALYVIGWGLSLMDVELVIFLVLFIPGGLLIVGGFNIFLKVYS